MPLPRVEAKKPQKTLKLTVFQLKAIRRWTKYHKKITVFEAYFHLKNAKAVSYKRDPLPRLKLVQKEIEIYITSYCGFKKTSEKRDGYIVYVHSEPSVAEKRIAKNYYARLKLLYHGDLEDGFSI